MDIQSPANDNGQRFFVYEWRRPNGEPFYVGKGCGRRDRLRARNNVILRRIIDKLEAIGCEPIVVRVKENLTEREAFDLEKELIAKYGRLNNKTGILANFTDGGEGTSGRPHSDETKRKIGLVHAGKTLSPEHYALLLERVRNPTPETRAKMGASQTGRRHTPETKEKMRANNGMQRPEVAAKVSAALRGKPKSEAHKQKIGQASFHKDPAHRQAISKSNRMRGPCGASQYKGVSFNKQLGKWKSAIRIGDKRPFLGYYFTAEEAARAYDRAAIDAWGLGNCYLNFPTIAANDNEIHGCSEAA